MGMSSWFPQAEEPGTSFFKGATNTQNILSKILEGRQNQQKLAQEALAEKNLNKYRMGSLDVSRGNLSIARMAEQRAQKLMPYLKQSYQDIHNKSASDHDLQMMENNLKRLEYDRLMKQFQQEQQQGTQLGSSANVQPNIQSQPQPQQVGQGLSPTAQQPIAPQQSLEDIMTPLFNQNYTLRKGENITPEQTVSNMFHNPVYYEPEAQRNASSETPVNQQPENVQQPAMPQSAMTPSAETPVNSAPNIQNEPIKPTGYKPGDEIVIKKSRPGMELQDKLAGTSFGKPIETKELANGWIYSKYPGGKITAIQNPYAAKEGNETPEQKRQADMQKQKELEEFKHGLTQKEKIAETKEKAIQKTRDKIDDTAKTLIPYMRTIQTLADITKRKPNLTGRGTQLASFVGMNQDPDVGTFNSGALALQQQMVKDFSSRGGYGLARIVQSAKPGIQKSNSDNEGALKEMKRKSVYSFVELKKDFEKNNPNEKFDYDLQDIYPTIDIETPDGKVLKNIPTNGGLQLIKDHPNHKVVG